MLYEVVSNSKIVWLDLVVADVIAISVYGHFAVVAIHYRVEKQIRHSSAVAVGVVSFIILTLGVLVCWFMELSC